MAAWEKAIEDTAYDVEFAFRERAPSERLPWDHIDILIPKKWFQEDWARAMELQHAPDCRAGKCHLCGVIFRERKLCQHMLKNQRLGRIEEKDWEPRAKEKYAEPPSLQRVRFRIGRAGEPRFLSHLEWMSAWVRTLRRAETPISYSQGFHVHPKLNFATALPVGEESRGEYMDVVLKERVDPGELLDRIVATLPKGFFAYEAEETPLKGPSLMSIVEGFSYSLHAPEADGEELSTRISEILTADEIHVERKGKAKGKGRQNRGRPVVRVDIRPMIAELEARTGAEGGAVVRFATKSVNEKVAKPKEILSLLGLDPLQALVFKEETFLAEITVPRHVV